MGGTTAPVCGSGSWPAWMASVSKPSELIVTSLTLPRAAPWSGELAQGKGPVPAGRAEEVLPPGGGHEPLQPVVLLGHPELGREVQRGLADAQPRKEIRRRHEDGELQFRLPA